MHPAYLAAMDRWETKRSLASMDAMAMFGVELLDEVPSDEESDWARKLKLLGMDFNLDDPVEREFFYKKYIALAGTDYMLLGSLSGLTEEAIAEAASSFRGN